jgi:hypothetical protein
MKELCLINHKTKISYCDDCLEEFCEICDFDWNILCLGCYRSFCEKCIYYKSYKKLVSISNVLKSCWKCHGYYG